MLEAVKFYEERVYGYVYSEIDVSPFCLSFSLKSYIDCKVKIFSVNYVVVFR